jgi:hypothetical protein
MVSLEKISYSECHGHIFMDGNNYRDAMELHRNGVVSKVIKERLKALSAAGVTYYRDGGDILGVSQYARSIAGDFGIEYRTCVFATHKKGNYGWIVGHGFTNSKEFYALVLRAKAEKADFIKLMISGIMDFQTFGGLTGGGLELSEIPELIKIAHGEGFRVMSHVNGADRIKASLEAGVDSVEHGYFMDDECISLLAETGAVWVPTLAAAAGFVGRGGFTPGIPERNIAHQSENIKKALRAGAFIAAGSDAGAYGVSPVEGISTEHSLLKKAGLSDDDIRRGDAAVVERFRHL